jgi:hypothetical protein
VLTTPTHQCHSVCVLREMSGEVEIVPGVVGPERIVSDAVVRPATIATKATVPGPAVRLDIRFDPDQHRYVCDELTVHRATSEALRHVPVEELVIEQLGEVEVAVNVAITAEGVLTVSDSVGLSDAATVEPWGRVPPDGVTEHGPTDRALRWVAHFYRWGYAVSYGGTKAVEELLGLSRSTAGRWVKLAREAGYLGPAEGPGKPGI